MQFNIKYLLIQSRLWQFLKIAKTDNQITPPPPDKTDKPII